MTAKEQQKMQRLEIQNRELRERISKNHEVSRNMIIEIVELKAKLELIESALYGCDQ